MRKIKSSVISSLLIAIFTTQLFSCGYILHPENRGQKSGKVDWAIAGLDSIGIIFFILPGVIAFAVDIYSGTIYLPHSAEKTASVDWNKIEKIKIDSKTINQETIVAALKQSRNVTINFEDPSLKIYSDKKLEMKLANRN